MVTSAARTLPAVHSSPASSEPIASTTITVDAATTANINGILTATPALTANGHVTFGAADGVNASPQTTFSPATSRKLTVGSQGTPVSAAATNHTARQVLVAASLSNTGLIDLSNNDMIVQGAGEAGLGTVNSGGIANQNYARPRQQRIVDW